MGLQWDLILVVVRGLRRENELGVLEKESLSSHEEEGEEEGQRRRRVEWKMARWGGGEGWRWKTEEVGGGRRRGKGGGGERARGRDDRHDEQTARRRRRSMWVLKRRKTLVRISAGDRKSVV